MPNPREEQLRSNRRLARQILGAAALLLAVIGLFTVMGWLAALLRIVTDNSAERRAYEDKLYGMVMLDARPFADAAEADPNIFREAAIWGTLYQIEQRDGNFDAYERDADTGALVLPRLEVDTWLSALLGPDYEIPVGSFETANFTYYYDEERQGYLVPVTGSVGLYIPQVEKISARGGRTCVTVGYIPTLTNSDTFMVTIPTDPVKYMDYLFERGENRQMRLVALQESEKQPEGTALPTEEPLPDADLQDLVQGSLDPAITDGAASAPAEDGDEAPAEDGDAAPEGDAEGGE